jgi:hypothetical protein
LSSLWGHIRHRCQHRCRCGCRRRSSLPSLMSSPYGC